VFPCKQAENGTLSGPPSQNDRAMLPGNRITSELAGRQEDRVFPVENAILQSQVLVNFPPRKSALNTLGLSEAKITGAAITDLRHGLPNTQVIH
jgi:hypothetical protein